MSKIQTLNQNVALLVKQHVALAQPFNVPRILGFSYTKWKMFSLFFSLIDLGIANDYIESDVIYYLK